MLKFLIGGLVVLLLPAPTALRLAAQSASDSTSVPGWSAIGSLAEERTRVDQLLGRSPTDGFLLRSTRSRLGPTVSVSPLRPHVQVLLPRLQATFNSALPYSLNDGALWAGRGANAAITGGVRASLGPVSLVLAPDIRYEQNREFRMIFHPDADRSRFAARWHWATLPISIDLPTRMGDEYRAFLGPGQSSVTIDAGPVQVGWATDEQWWGPGIRNAIVLSNNAPGIPRVFVGSGRPLATPLGRFEFLWNAGRLTESIYFDSISSNDLRHFSGFGLTFSPAIEPGLTLGASRAVVGRLTGMDDFPNRMFSALLNKDGREEQIASLFARWIFPGAGFETYAEWARHRLTGSLRELLISPNHTQGYTLGLQWVRPTRADSSHLFRLQTEVTYLEQSTTTRSRPTGSFYTSGRLAQGYTHRGQVIGAAIGPGSSSQWIAADYLGRDWQAGLFASRIRWDTDAYYLTQEPTPLDHDVSVVTGIRGAARLFGSSVELELATALRYNFMFQNSSKALGAPGDWDIRNHTLKIGIAPAPASPRPRPAPPVEPPPAPVP